MIGSSCRSSDLSFPRFSMRPNTGTCAQCWQTNPHDYRPVHSTSPFYTCRQPKSSRSNWWMDHMLETSQADMLRRSPFFCMMTHVTTYLNGLLSAANFLMQFSKQLLVHWLTCKSPIETSWLENEVILLQCQPVQAVRNWVASSMLATERTMSTGCICLLYQDMAHTDTSQVIWEHPRNCIFAGSLKNLHTSH